VSKKNDFFTLDFWKLLRCNDSHDSSLWCVLNAQLYEANAILHVFFSNFVKLKVAIEFRNLHTLHMMRYQHDFRWHGCRSHVFPNYNWYVKDREIWDLKKIWWAHAKFSKICADSSRILYSPSCNNLWSELLKNSFDSTSWLCVILPSR